MAKLVGDELRWFSYLDHVAREVGQLGHVDSETLVANALGV